MEDLERGQRGGAGHRVARIGITVEQFDAGRRIHEGVVDVRLAEHGAHRNHAVGQPFGGGHQVRLDAEIVGGERRGEAAEAGDDFIEDQQDAVLVAQLAQTFQITLGRDQHAGGAGHRFDDDGGDVGGVMQGDDALEFIGQVDAVFRLAPGPGIEFEIVGVRQVIDAGQQRPEALAVAADAAHRQAAEADPVVAPFAADQAGSLPFAAGAVVGQRHLEGGVDRFRAGVGIEHVAEFVAAEIHQLFGQVEGGRVAHLEGGREVELADHFAHGGDDLRLVVPGRARTTGRRRRRAPDCRRHPCNTCRRRRPAGADWP